MQMVEPICYDAKVRPITASDFDTLKKSVPSAVGHADTAAVLGVACHRVNVSLTFGDTIAVAQLQGGRLPEGATTLPSGYSFKYYLVTITDPV